MASNFQRVLERRNDLLHRRSIWSEVIDHLKKFLDTDATPATVGIATEGEGLTVPQAHIEQEITEITSGYLAEIEEELKKIDKSEVAEHVEQKNKGSKKKASRRKKAGAKKAPGRPKAQG
jgi:hypothetical protein